MFDKLDLESLNGLVTFVVAAASAVVALTLRGRKHVEKQEQLAQKVTIQDARITELANTQRVSNINISARVRQLEDNDLNTAHQLARLSDSYDSLEKNIERWQARSEKTHDESSKIIEKLIATIEGGITAKRN